MTSTIFMCDDVKELLCNKFIVIIGDSVQRGIYKDIVLLLQKNKFLSEANLRNKGEMSFTNDELIEGGKKGRMTNGTSYCEVRQFQTDHHLVRFYFVTRCFSEYMVSVLADLSCEPRPDVVMLNSCLWDISRYGQSSIEEYKENLRILFVQLNEVLPEACMVIWNTTMPISKNARGGFLIPEIEFMNSTLRLDILEANFYAAQIALDQGCDVLDLHYYLRDQLYRRANDGVHWNMEAHRKITNLILSHIADAWGVSPPNHSSQLGNKTDHFRFGFSHHGKATAQELEDEALFRAFKVNVDSKLSSSHLTTTSSSYDQQACSSDRGHSHQRESRKSTASREQHSNSKSRYNPYSSSSSRRHR